MENRKNNREAYGVNKDEVLKQIENKKTKIEKIVNNKSKYIEQEVSKRKKGEDKIELMTQFMINPTSSATKLLEKRREMYELQDALQRDKEKFKEKGEQFKKTEEELRNKDEAFHKSIVDYYLNFFKSNQKESQGYNLKLAHEEKMKDELQKSIDNLKTKNKKLKEDLNKLQTIHNSLKKYEDYLKNVKEAHSDNFNEINLIIKKYDDLKGIYENIKEEEDKAKLKKEEEKKNFRDTKSHLETKINGLISDIQTTQSELKRLKEDKKILENEVATDEANSNSVVSSLEQILLAIDNIHNKCKDRKDWTLHEFDSTAIKSDGTRRTIDIAKEKIKNINAYISDYASIIDTYKKKKNE